MGRSQESALEGILTPGVLLELAGARYFERGEGYHDRGLVRALIEHEGTVAAKVLGTHEYRVRLWAEGDELRHSCDCPLGMAGEFCKHCVAVGLASFEGNSSQNAPGGSVTMDDVRAYLEEHDKDALVGIILEQAMELAARREEDQPEDSLSVYEARIEPLIERTSNTAYQEAYELLLKVRRPMRRLDREQEFDEYLELLRSEYKRKRNFMKLLDKME